MQTIIVIGKEGDQPFKIDTPGVSRRHARLIIEDDIWTLEDMNSTNGTYVQEADGSYVRIGRSRISPTTRVRLGDGTVTGGCSFSARRVVAEVDDYGPEFDELEHYFNKMQDQLQMLRKQRRQRQLLIALVPLALMLVSIIFPFLALTGLMRI